MVYGPVAANISATNSGTTEATLVATPVMSAAPPGGAGYLVEATVTFTGNASASTTTFKIRQNSASGTTVYTSPAFTVAAAAVVSIDVGFLDLSAAAGGISSYVITQTNSAAAGNSGTITGYVKVTAAQEND